MSYTVLTTKQTAAITDKLAKIDVLSAEIGGILSGAVVPASQTVEGQKKPGRPRKIRPAKAEAAKPVDPLA